MILLRYGIDTSRWYTPYQRLVRGVPVFGSMSTNHWYDNKTFPYRSLRTPREGGNLQKSSAIRNYFATLFSEDTVIAVCNSLCMNPIMSWPFSLIAKFISTCNSLNSGVFIWLLIVKNKLIFVFSALVLAFSEKWMMVARGLWCCDLAFVLFFMGRRPKATFARLRHICRKDLLYLHDRNHLRGCMRHVWLHLICCMAAVE